MSAQEPSNLAALCASLKQALEAEREALLQQDCDDLIAIAKHKATLAEALEARFAREGLEALNDDKGQQESVRDVLKTCEQLNRDNAAMVHPLKRHIEQAIAIATGSNTGHQTTYRKSGVYESRGRGNRLTFEA